MVVILRHDEELLQRHRCLVVSLIFEESTVTTHNSGVCSDLPRHRNLEFVRRRMTYDGFGREKKRRHESGEQKPLMDSLDGDVDQRADRMGRSSGVKTGEAVWSVV